jgi:hypothetical protein
MGFAVGTERRYWLGVMALDKSFATLPIYVCEVELAYLAEYSAVVP